MKLYRTILSFVLVFCLGNVFAGKVEVIETVFVRQGASWRVDTTLRHTDTGWQHYADAWRVVDNKGKVLATRVLVHPHVHEQPFTRTLYDVVIPKGTSVVYVEAHDKVHGWSKQRIRVDLNRKQGDHFRVRR